MMKTVFTIRATSITNTAENHHDVAANRITNFGPKDDISMAAPDPSGTSDKINFFKLF